MPSSGVWSPGNSRAAVRYAASAWSLSSCEEQQQQEQACDAGLYYGSSNRMHKNGCSGHTRISSMLQ
jgi:hypothetical protein